MKTIINILIAIIVLTGVIGYVTYKHRLKVNLEKQHAKAPEQTITFIEGWTTEEMGRYLEDRNVVTGSVFERAARYFKPENYPLLASKPFAASLEGFLFPDTYRIAKPAQPDEQKTSEEIIVKALDNFSVKFSPDMEQAARARGLTVYDAVIMASVIERETGRNAVSAQARQNLDEERKIIAGIFYRRLALGMPLQSDATVNYVTKKTAPAVSESDTKIDSPYNTYKYPGLPPGPISNPSLSSLRAAVYPAQTDYLYFLHKQPSGEPVYSKTFEEHVQNKLKYLK